MFLNRIMIAGNLGGDVELRFTPSGKPVASFSVAVNRRFQNGAGETIEETEWFNIVAWNRIAEICNQYLSKGANVYIEGRLQTQQWQDNQGQNHKGVEVVASNVQFVNLKGQNIVGDDTEEVAKKVDEATRPKTKSNQRVIKK